MKLIIEMPDEAYNKLIKEQHLPSGLDVEYFIIHGTPLPKGHGDLISRDFMKEMGATCIAKRISTGELVAISSIDELTEELGKIKADKGKTQMVDKSNFDIEQYKADLQSAYDCGYVKGQVDIDKENKE